MPAPIAEGRLTRRLFAQLPTGCFLVSNVCDAPWKPVFAEVVAPVYERHGQWLRIRACRADQRLCHAFAGPEEYRAFYRAFPVHLP